MRWLAIIFVRPSGWMSARSGARNAGEVGRETEPATRTMGARLLIAAGTGVVCAVVYASGIPADPVSVDFLQTRLSTGGSSGAEVATSPMTAVGSERPGLIERVGRLQLEDVVGFIADDGLGTVAGELGLLVVPVGTPAWRLSLAAALLGAATVSLLVAIMLNLGAAPFAAVASALAFAASDPIRVAALTVEPALIRAPLLALALYFLTLRTNRGRPPWPWLAAFTLWGVSAIAEPMLLCVLPGIAAFMYLVERGRSTCGHLTVLTACAGSLLFGWLLAVNGVGIRTWAGAANAAPADTLVAQTGLLGLAFLAAAVVHASTRPTREELLGLVGWLGVMAWVFSAEVVDGRQLSTAFLLTCPVVGLGMSAVVRSRPDRGFARAVCFLCFVLPASNYARAVEPVETLLHAREHWVAHARALADVLPENAALVTTANVREPITGLWRFTGVRGRRVVEVPLDVRRVQELRGELPVFVFEPTRRHLELLGFRFSNLGRVRAEMSLETYLDRLPQGTMVAAAGEAISASALNAFRSIGGGRVSAGGALFYGVVGTVGGRALVEDANPRRVSLQVAEGSDRPGAPPFPVELEIRSTPGGAWVDIDGETAAKAAAGVTVVILRSSGRPQRVLSAIERDGDLRIPVRLRRQPMSRLDAWEPCTWVGTRSWVDVSRTTETGDIGIHFGSHARSARLALYVAGADVLPDIFQADSSPTRARIERDGFDRRDAGDAAALGRLLAADDVSPWRFAANERYVQRVLAGRDSDVQPLAAIRVDGRPGTALARLVGADDGAYGMVCTAPS